MGLAAGLVKVDVEGDVEELFVSNACELCEVVVAEQTGFILDGNVVGLLSHACRHANSSAALSWNPKYPRHKLEES